MLLSFNLSNWACFRDTVSFTMQAGSERDTNKHLIKVGAKSRPLKVLPMAAIYGSNASGKSQFVSALAFLRNLVLEEYKTGRLPVRPFLLDDTFVKEPTRFLLQFIVSDVVYELDVSLTDVGIRREVLSKYNTRNTAKTTIYERDGAHVLSCTWGGEAYCQYVKTMTVDPTRLFLTLSAILSGGKDTLISSIYDWFAETLVIITPNTFYVAVDDYCRDSAIANCTIGYLSRFDSGISRLASESVPLSTLPGRVIEDVRKVLKPGTCHQRLFGNEVFVFEFDEVGELTAKRLVAHHTKSTGEELTFPMSYESDGTRRMLDLIPGIARLTEPNREMIFVVDEIDNKLHHLVTRALINDFVATCNAERRAQLVFTTHDLLLMDQDLCRRDEMWVTDKAPDGSASLFDLSSFEKLRKDSNIRDIYLDGRLGGVPRHI